MPQAISNDQIRFADQFVLSCGTITIDTTHHKVLLIHSPSTNQVLLPKGRKNIGERLEDAAVRETYEETGYRVKVHPTKTHTLATTSKFSVESTDKNAEPFVVSQRITADGTLKIIFWYVAEGDSTAERELGTQEEDEDFVPLWVGFRKVKETLTFDGDVTIVERAIEM